jgi:hypothetical protein
MLNPQERSAGSGPTITAPQARADTELAREPATGRFIGSGGAGRSVAERRVITARRAQVEALYPEKTCAEIAVELGWATPTIWQDVKALKLERRQAGARRKHPEPQERECANPDCDKRFTPRSWAPEQRFHDIPCARAAQTTERVRERARELMTDHHRRAAEEIERLNAAGFLTSRQLAAERKVTESTVSQWISRGLLSAERRIIEGEPHQIVARSEFERFEAEEWPRICKRMGPGYPSNWSGHRVRAWSGRLTLIEAAPLGGQKKGKAEGITVAKLALRIVAAHPTWSPKQVIDALTYERHGRDFLFWENGKTRPADDPEYRRGRARTERALARGLKELNFPPEIVGLLPRERL